MSHWYILGKGRKRKAPSQKSTEASKRKLSSAPNDSDKDKDSGLTGPSKQASGRKKRGHDEDSDEQTAESSDEESALEDEDEDEESFDLEPYDYLLGQAHYDPEDNGVFKSVKIVAEDFGNGAEVVVYRSHYNSNSGKWGKVNLNDPIKVGDVIKYQRSKANVAKLNAVLKPITAKPKKK